MAKTDYGRDMFRPLTEVMARLEKVEQSQQIIEKHLLDAPQVSTDRTVVTENGHRSYIRNFSIADWVLYGSMGSKRERISQVDCGGPLFT